MTELEVLHNFEYFFYMVDLPFLKNIKNVLDNVIQHREHEECNHCKEELSGK